MANLEQLRAKLAAARQAGEVAPGELIALAEHEPVLERGGGAVRALLHEAAARLDTADDPALRGRVMRRLAYVKMIEGELDGAAESARRAIDFLDQAGARDAALAAGCLACRIELRRGGAELVRPVLVQAAGQITGAESEAHDAATELALAIAELSIESGEDDGHEMLEELLPSLQEDEARLDAAWTASQLLAMQGLAAGRPEAAVRALRIAFAIAKRALDRRDELQVRISLAGALAVQGGQAALMESEKHLQVVRDVARDLGEKDLHVAALIGQAGLLAGHRRRVHAGIDRCLEIARLAAADNDVPRYVAAVGLMARLYEQSGDHASAYRTIAEAYHGLKSRMTVDPEPLFRPHLDALADVVGPERFRAIVADVNAAQQLAGTLPGSS